MAVFEQQKKDDAPAGYMPEKKGIILLVDDEPANLRTMERVLSPKFHVIGTTCPREALDALQKAAKDQPVQVILTDQRMPEMTGIEFLRKSAEIAPDAIGMILSGYTDVDVILQAINDGKVYKYLTKPIDPNTLLITVQRAAEKYELMRQNEKLVAELKELNETLEKKVEERTRELEKSRDLIADYSRRLEVDKERFRKIAITDPLTNVYSRRHILETLADEMERINRYGCRQDGTTFSVALIDIDFFKSINDTFGHQVGDDVLIKVTVTIRGLLRMNDKLGRYGGEEFLLILPATNVTKCCRVLERIREAVAGLSWPFPNRTVTISAGCTDYVPGESERELLNRCDSLLYKAKEAGRNRVACT